MPVWLEKDAPNTLHRIAEPIQTETTINGEKTVQRTYYRDWGSNSYKVWPEFVKTLKGDFDAMSDEEKKGAILFFDKGNFD